MKCNDCDIEFVGNPVLGHECKNCHAKNRLKEFIKSAKNNSYEWPSLNYPFTLAVTIENPKNPDFLRIHGFSEYGNIDEEISSRINAELGIENFKNAFHANFICVSAYRRGDEIILLLCNENNNGSADELLEINIIIDGISNRIIKIGSHKFGDYIEAKEKLFLGENIFFVICGKVEQKFISQIIGRAAKEPTYIFNCYLHHERHEIANGRIKSNSAAIATIALSASVLLGISLVVNLKWCVILWGSVTSLMAAICIVKINALLKIELRR